MDAKSRRRWTIMAVVGGLVFAVLVFLIAPRPVAVDAAGVVRGPIDESVSDLGQAQVRDSYVVSAPVAGRLERTPLKVGDRVVAGSTVLARLRPADPALLDPSILAQRQAVLASARATRSQLDAERVRTAAYLERVRPLADQGVVSRQAVDDAIAAAAASSRAVAAADAQVRAAEAGLMGPGARGGGLVIVTAPTSGYVTRVPEPSERTVPVGAPLIEVSPQGGLEAAIEFLSQDAVRIREGMAAEIYDWGGPGVLEARVRRIEPAGFTKISALGVEEQRALVRLEFTGPAEARAGLAPGYRVWGRVFLRRERSAVVAPIGALVRSEGSWAVYRIEGGKARLRRVTVGAVTDRSAEIRSGLAAGDRVILFPSDVVKDGVRVKARKP